MFVLHRLRYVVAVAAVAGVTAFALHTAGQTPTPGRYISWAPPASATATPGAGPPIAMASPSPVVDPGPLSGLTTPLSGLFKQLNANTAATEKGQYTILQTLENALAAHVRQFLQWVTGGR